MRSAASEHAQRGEPAHIIFKMNALVDKPMIKLLYAAARAGVQIDLIVRSICGLRPGIKGLSENVRVRSIVGRFLEHSRIYWFANAGQPEVFVGSADLMPRNIDRRVEVLFPVGDPRLVRSIRDDILGVYLADNVKARQLKPDGLGNSSPTAATPGSLRATPRWSTRRRSCSRADQGRPCRRRPQPGDAEESHLLYAGLTPTLRTPPIRFG